MDLTANSSGILDIWKKKMNLVDDDTLWTHPVSGKGEESLPREKVTGRRNVFRVTKPGSEKPETLEKMTNLLVVIEWPRH